MVDAPPRALAPLSLGDVTQRRPRLRWALSPGYDGAVVELCRDRACTMVLETLTVAGSSAQPTVDLSPRAVVFWRMRGRVGSTVDTVFGPTWLFHTPAVSARGVDVSASPHLDVNGDGYDDVAIGAYTADPSGRVDAGSASVFLGGPTGLAGVAAVVLGGVAAYDRFGISVASAGDVDGDGYGDLVVDSTPDGSSGSTSPGTASVYRGSAAGVVSVPIRVFSGVAAGDSLGSSVAGAGDVDGDGFADVLVGAPGAIGTAGAASVFHGSANGVLTSPARVLVGVAGGDGLGGAVAGVGDVNRDGYADVVVSAWSASTGGLANAGTANLFHGSAAGVPTMATRVLNGPLADDRWGVSVACARPRFLLITDG